MFSGIVSGVGEIRKVVVAPLPLSGVHLEVSAGALDLSDLAVGSSIAVQGVCLSVVAFHKVLNVWSFSVDVSDETRNRTCGLERLGPVNLEKSIRCSDRLDGHLVSGHVDGIGQVVQAESSGFSRLLSVETSRALAPYLALKGAITVDGVSLTVNQVEDLPNAVRFSVNVIPHTLLQTTLQNLTVGSSVNVEVDMLARYCARILGVGTSAIGE